MFSSAWTGRTKKRRRKKNEEREEIERFFRLSFFFFSFSYGNVDNASKSENVLLFDVGPLREHGDDFCRRWIVLTMIIIRTFGHLFCCSHIESHIEPPLEIIANIRRFQLSMISSVLFILFLLINFFFFFFFFFTF